MFAIRTKVRSRKVMQVKEIPGNNMLDKEQRALLLKKICKLPLRIESSHLAELITKLYQELDTAGISFKPKTYLTDDWGCPDKVPVIGIPFDLADMRLRRLKTQLTGMMIEDDAALMMLLRHEAGHTFNYAYRLYNKPEWRKLFGRFSLPYTKYYKVDPFSTRFVRHLSGWYAQRHPDDDFAETFAVWLTPGLDWQKEYAGTQALEKLMYVGKAAARYGKKPPVVTGGKLDIPVEDMEMTLGEFFRTMQQHRDKNVGHPRL